MTTVLEMNGIEKRFGPVHALGGVNFDVAQGEVHALLGVNGAGKSTLMKVLSGIYTPDAGDIRISGQSVSIRSPSAAIDAGIASVQQHPELVEDLTGYENIFLGQEGNGRGLFRPVERAEIKQRALEILERLPVDIDLDTPVRKLSGVGRELVAILHALKHEHVKILILDEPTSTLTQVEAEQLFKMMDTLKAAGVSIIYITHRLDEVFRVADRFTVFRGGQKIVTMSCDEASENDVSIPQLMLQEEFGELYPEKPTKEQDGPAILEVRRLEGSGFKDVNLSVRKGEITGLFGLVGSGIDELAKTIFGVMPPITGDILINGKPVKLRSSAAALKNGIFLVPGDRRTEGLVMTDHAVFNATIANPKRASGLGGLLHFRRNRSSVSELAKKVDLQPPSVKRPASDYSGGNQQKIVITKGLYSQANIYLFVEPTVGVDVGARAKIYALIRELSQNAAVVVLSSDYDEVFGVADRIGALYRGRMVLAPERNIGRDALLAAGIAGE